MFRPAMGLIPTKCESPGTVLRMPQATKFIDHRLTAARKPNWEIQQAHLSMTTAQQQAQLIITG